MAVPRLREGSVRLPGADIWYQEMGSGPAVLLLHAGVADHRMWSGQMEAFATSCRVVACDARGFGRSPDRAGPFSYTQDILGLLDHLGILRAVLVGCSMFGTPVVRVALNAPERVRGLVLVGAWVHGFEPSAAAPDIEEDVMAAEERGDWERLVELEEQLWLAGPTRPVDAVSPHLRKLYREMNEGRRLAHGAAARDVDGETSDIGRVQEIACPTLIVHGEHDVSYIGELSEFLRAQIPRSEAALLPATAHLPPLEAPSEFNRLVLDWLARLPA